MTLRTKVVWIVKLLNNVQFGSDQFPISRVIALVSLSRSDNSIVSGPISKRISLR